MKIAYQVKFGDAITGESIGRNAWFEDAEKAMTESYVIMEQMENQYGSFLLWDAGIPFIANEDNSEIIILQGIMPGITTKEKPFSLQISRKHVQDGFDFDKPSEPQESINEVQILLRKNMGRYFNRMDQMELETYRRGN
jgi:hypothetical protein